MRTRLPRTGTLRRAVAQVAVTCAMMVGAVLAPGSVAAAPLQPPAQAPPAGSAAADYGACLTQQKSGDLLLLIDESGSLKEADPDAARVTAATYLLRRLSEFSQRRNVELRVAVAAFANEFSLPTGWTTLGPETLPTLVDGVTSFRNRTSGIETDYWTAMEGARRALADDGRPAGGLETTPCRAIA